MRLGSVLTVTVAVGLAIAAGVLSQNYLERQRGGAPAVASEARPTGQKVVVATQALRFGQELAPSQLAEVDWPGTAVPGGSFTSIADLLRAGDRRVVLSSIEPNEPILKSKVTGPGQRASLSALISPGMKAVTIRVNDVLGVAGFVLPGDRVDVLMTKYDPQQQTPTKTETYTDVLLQNVRVLGVDQLADDKTDKPSVAKAVTLEVALDDSQRITLAATLGNLSLSLRPAGSADIARPSRVTAAALEADATGQSDAEAARNHVIVVTRSVQRSTYVVPVAVR